MPNDLVRYDLRLRSALLGLIRDVLTEVARDGLPGDHHLWIEFKTAAPGVKISNGLREKYPNEMAIVLQHHFWDLKAAAQHFEVGLSFSNVPEKLVVPFEAITQFRDPHVNFALVFDADVAPASAEPEAADAKSPAETRRAGLRGRASEPKESAPALAATEKRPPKSKTAQAAVAAKPETPAADPVEPTADKVVSLDAFRRKP